MDKAAMAKFLDRYSDKSLAELNAMPYVDLKEEIVV